MKENSKLKDSVVIRLEDILNGYSLENLIQNSISTREKYIEHINERLNKLYNDFASLKVDFNADEIKEYYEMITLLNKPSKEYSNEEKIKVFNVYTDIINHRFGPFEKITDNRIYEENFTLEDVFNVKHVFPLIKHHTKRLFSGPPFIETIKKIEYFESMLLKLTSYNEYRFPFAIDRNVFFKNYDKVVSFFEEMKKNGISGDLVIDSDGKEVKNTEFDLKVPYYYTTEQLEKLESFKYNNFIEKIHFSEFYPEIQIPFLFQDIWTFEDVFNANKNVHYISYLINNADLTPFEKLLLINRVTSNCNYTGTATSREQTRTFLTADDSVNRTEYLLKENKAFVCTCYSSYAKVLIDSLKDNNLKAMTVPVKFYDRKTGRKTISSTHLVLIVYVNDPKYDVSGYGMYDPTWSKNSYDFILCPISDLKKYRKYNVKFEDGAMNDCYRYLNCTREEFFDKSFEDSKIFNEYEQNSVNVDYFSFVFATNNMLNKIKRAGTYNFFVEEGIEPDDVLTNDIDYTFKNIIDFDPETSQNAFYVYMRNFFKGNEEKYPNWEEKWDEYIEGKNLN